jgi:hypothetical protein
MLVVCGENEKTGARWWNRNRNRDQGRRMLLQCRVESDLFSLVGDISDRLLDQFHTLDSASAYLLSICSIPPSLLGSTSLSTVCDCANDPFFHEDITDLFAVRFSEITNKPQGGSSELIGTVVLAHACT